MKTKNTVKAVNKETADPRGPADPVWGPNWLNSTPSPPVEAAANPSPTPPETPPDPVDSAPWILTRDEANAIWNASYEPVECPTCGHIEVWWDGLDNPHCMKCDPPSQAGIEFMQRAAALRRRIERKSNQ